MGFHPEGFALTQYLRTTVPELVSPLEAALSAGWTEGDDPPNGLHLIYLGFYQLALHFGAVDNYLCEDEVALLRDVGYLFGAEANVQDRDFLTTADWREIYRNNVREHPHVFNQITVPPAVQYLKIYDARLGTDYADKAKAMYFRFANALIKADGTITRYEEIELSQFRDLLYTPSLVTSSSNEVLTPGSMVAPPPTPVRNEEPRPLDDLIDELNSLVGLGQVKDDVFQLVNFLKVQQLRQTKGLATVPISRHLVFYGNPGTGKTTVARLLSQIYKSLNILSRGHLVETDRTGLVAGYVGQTGLKVREIVATALGGILFIDEAYSLAGEGQDYGREAIDTLIKLMEDNRDELIVVVAGYTDKMNKFLLSNPGLKSRFNKYFNFEDYSPIQLGDIFELFCKNAGFQLSSDGREKVLAIFQVLFDVRDETFGNARLARNVFERAINNQANRIISLAHIDETVLSTLLAIDIPGEVELHTIEGLK